MDSLLNYSIKIECYCFIVIIRTVNASGGHLSYLLLNESELNGFYLKYSRINVAVPNGEVTTGSSIVFCNYILIKQFDFANLWKPTPILLTNNHGTMGH